MGANMALIYSAYGGQAGLHMLWHMVASFPTAAIGAKRSIIELLNITQFPEAKFITIRLLEWVAILLHSCTLVKITDSPPVETFTPPLVYARY